MVERTIGWMKNNVGYLLRFLVIGGAVVALDFSTYSLLYLMGTAMSLANIIGMVAGFVGGFFLHKNVTFKVTRAGHSAMFGRYLLAFLINLVIAHHCLQLFHQLTDEAFFAKFATMFVVFMSNFLISRYFVFIPSQPG